MNITITSTKQPTPKEVDAVHHPSTSTQNLNLHSSPPDPNPNPDPQQSLRDALSRKRKQLFAARLGHSNIPIEPLERQISRLTGILDSCQEVCEQRSEEAYKESVGVIVKWVVVPVWTCRVGKGDDEVRKGGELDRMVVRQDETLPGERVEGERDPEKFLGTWI